MIDRYTVIQELERCARGQCDICQKCHVTGFPDGTLSYRCAWHDELVQNAIDLLKTHDISLEELANNYGLTIDGVQFALEQYQTVICEITKSRMSKLSYFARDILQVADEVMCDGCELKEAQEPRVMTLEEIDALEDSALVYIECAYFFDGQRKTVIKPAIYQADNSSPEEDGYYCIVSAWAQSGFYNVDSYGIDWRCWTSRPTDAQREVTPWND